MAPLRFPGRPGYRFDKIGVRYCADEARHTTDPTLAIIANINKGLQQFRNIFGDSDEEDTEFLGFTPAEVRAAERNLLQVIKEEKQLREQQAQKQKYRFERSKATLASLAAAGLEFAKKTQGAPDNLRKTYKKIIETNLVKDTAHKIRSKRQPPVAEVTANGKQNGQPVPKKISNLKHITLKRLSHNADLQPVFRRPVGRPRKHNINIDLAADAQKGSSFESIMAASSVFGAKPISKYTSMARQILARATKQAVHTSNKLLTSTHKVRKFVLPTKSSRSSRVIKPNKRFLEDDSVHQLVAKQPKISPTSPSSITSFKTPIFGMGVGVDKSNSFSAFQSCGLSLTSFNMNREKGFPVFSAPPQPSGTSSFMDGLANQKPLGSLDQPLIVEGKRPRKPSLIMRMKLVEDDPADEIRLQQQMSDATNSVKSSDGQKPLTDSKFSTPQMPTLTKGFGATKSLIAPAKLFTDSSTYSLSSKSFKHQHSLHSKPSQSTVVLRQAKFQLNRTALNRSKAALARSLKAQLKREAKLERKKRTSQNRLERLSGSTPSSGSSLSQLSPFSKLASDSAIERQKSGLFEGIEAGAGSFSPSSFGSPPVTPSSLPATKFENKKAEVYQASLIKEESLLINYSPESKWRCLVCSNLCIVKKNRKLPQVPLCKSCKKSYFFKLNPKSKQMSKRKLKCEGKCNIHFSQKSHLHCVQCKFAKFEAIMKKCKELGIESYKIQKEEKEPLVEEPFSPVKKQRHKSEEMVTPESRRNKQKREESDGATPTRRRHKHKSGDKVTELSGLRQSAKSPSHNKEFINASNLDKPLSVDVGQDTDPFSLSPPQTLSSTKSSPDKNSRPPSKKFSLTSNGSDKVSENDEDNDTGRSRGNSRGPRIKHVCRRAAMVFPQQRATFPEEPQKRTLTLSALPNEEKQQLWAKSKQEKTEDSSTEDSSDDKPQSKMATITSPDKKLLSPKDDKQTDIRKERKMGLHLDKKTPCKDEKTDDVKEGKISRNKATETKTVQAIANKMKKKNLSSEREKALKLAARRRGYTRKIRCKECKGCKTPECGVCVFCRDKPKFGGPGRIKKCCIHSVCLAPKIPRKATQAFIEPKSPTKTYRRDDDDQNGDHHTRSHNSGTGFKESSSRYQEKRANNHWKMDGNGNGATDDGEGATEDMDTFHQNGLISGPTSSSVPNGLDMDGSRFRSKTGTCLNNKVVRYAKGRYTPAVEATIQLALTDVRNPFIGRMADTYIGRMKQREKISVPHKQLQVELKPVQNETAYSFDVPLKTHLIQADYEEDYDVELAWSHGFSLTLTGPSCVRALCYLCGSAGKHEMLYCIVCCQPYHSFCLDEDERPEEEDNEEEGDDCVDDSNHHNHGGTNSSTISWCCRRCQFCHVCGHQNGLLKCHRCKDTYHPECLGPNYPTRPSHKNIWVCTKCVRCKSCGATTPGVGTNATWTYDFSLCYECGKLMDKGNFCPICHKCYSDDDWESKMVQCAICESWVHAKCEELTDEMYQLVSFLPEEVQYTCRVCSTDSPPYWERVLKSELVNGLLNVLNGLLVSKSAQMLLDSGPPRDYRKLKQIKGRNPDESRIIVDDNSNNETTPNIILNGSADNVDSPQDISVADSEHVQEEQYGVFASKHDGQAVPRSTDSSISSYIKHLLTRHDKEIIEKCDCETVQTSSDHQTALYSHTSGRNILFSDKLADTDNNNVGSHNTVEKTDDINSFLRTSETSLSSHNVVGLKDAARKGLTTCELENVINGESDLYTSADDRNDTDVLLGLVSREGDIGNSKMLLAINNDMKCSIDFNKTVHSNCDRNNCLNSVCSSVTMAVSTSSYQTVLANSSQNLPTVSSLCMQGSLNIHVTDAQPNICTKNVLSASSVSSVPPASFYPNCNRENMVKNLLSNHQSTLPEFVQKSGPNNILQSSSVCAFSLDLKDHNSMSENGRIGNISMENNSTFVESIKPTVDTECNINSALIQQNGTCVDHLQQQIVPSLTTAATKFHLDMVEHSGNREHGEKTHEKEIVSQNPARCLHVSFGATIQEAVNQNGEFPRDFNSIRLKIDSGLYSTVEEFSEDMVRIIQTLLFENEQYTTRKKQANSVRSIFIKQMERFFPWFNVNTCKLWEHNRGLPVGMLRDAVLPPSGDHTYAQWLERKNSPMSPQPSPFKRVNSPQRRSALDGENLDITTTEKMQHHLVQNEDTRACLLCQKLGDDGGDFAGRLLYCGQDDWIHINCALWSAEVFEQDDGSLQNVQEAVSRAKKLRCNLCQLTGATVGCCEANCRANYHFMCARADKCVFQEDKTIFCQQHSDCANMNVVKDGHFDISSRVCVNLDKIRAKSSWGKAVDPATLNVIIGSCTVESLGVLQSSLSDTEECLFPVDFRCTRIYWSTQDARRRCVYTCRVVKIEPDIDSPGVKIHDLRVVHDENHPDFIPLEQLNLESLGIPNFIKQSSKVCGLTGETCDEIDDVVFMGSDLTSMSVTSASFSSQSVTVCTSTHISSITAQTVDKLSPQPGLFQTIQDQILQSKNSDNCFIVSEDDPHGIPKSWLVRPQKQKTKVVEPKPIDLSGLSPSTLALLSIKDPSRYLVPPPRLETGRSNGDVMVGTKNFPVVEEKELGLIKIADRLNNAASGRARQLTNCPDRSILRSPTFPLCSPKQQYRQFHLQTQQSKSQCPSPVSFKPMIRPRSNSEGKHENVLTSMSSPGGIITVFPASLSYSHTNKARSESPLSVIKPCDLISSGLRSSSLSPPPVTIKKDYSLSMKPVSFPSPSSLLPTLPHYLNPHSSSENSRTEIDTCKERTSKSVTVTPLTEVLESEDDERMTIENANKKSNLDPNLHFDNFEENEKNNHLSFLGNDERNFEERFDDAGSSFDNVNTSGELISDIISTENLKSILESVPPEVLEGENVKLIVLSDIDHLTEDDVIKLASSVLQESSGDQVSSSGGELSDNDGQQGEEATHENKAEGENSDQGNQGNSNSVDDNHNSPETDGGSDATYSGRDLKESNNTPSSSTSNMLSSDHTPFCQSNSTDLGLVRTSSNSGDTHEGNGDDDDLRKPYKDEKNKKNKDIIFRDFDENVIEKDNESQDISFEGHSKLVNNLEKSTEGQNHDKIDCSEVCSRNVISDELHVVKENVPSSLIKISDEVDHIGVTSSNKVQVCSLISQNEKCLPLSSDKERLITTASESGDAICKTCKYVECDKPQCGHLPSVKKNTMCKKDVTVDSTIHVMDEAQIEADDSADQSFTEMSEDDIKIIDLSDSEKAERLENLEIITLKASEAIATLADVKNTKIVEVNCVPREVIDKDCIQSSGKLILCSGSSAMKTQVSDLTHNVKVIVNSNQSRTKAGVSVFVGTQDTTTDEESDYLMLDDFSYSETNDEDDCTDGRRSAEKGKESLQTALPEVDCKAICEDLSQEPNLLHLTNVDMSNMQTTRELRGNNAQKNPNYLLVEKSNEWKIEEGQVLSQTPLQITSSYEKCGEIKSAETEIISGTMMLSKCLDNSNSFENNVLDEHPCSDVDAVVENRIQSFCCKSEVKLKPCYVSLCRRGAESSQECIPSLNCDTAGTSTCPTSELSQMQLRGRNLPVNDLKPSISNNYSSSISIASRGQACPETKQKVVNVDKKSGSRNVEESELLTVDHVKADISEEVNEDTLLELNESKLIDEERRNEQESARHLPEVPDNEKFGKAIELKEKTKAPLVYINLGPENNVSVDLKGEGKDIEKNESVSSTSISGCVMKDFVESYHDTKSTVEKGTYQLYQEASSDQSESSKPEMERHYGESNSSESLDKSTCKNIAVVANQIDILSQNLSSPESYTPDKGCEERIMTPIMISQTEDLNAIVSRETHTNIYNIDSSEILQTNEMCCQQNNKQKVVTEQTSSSDFLNHDQQEGCIGNLEIMEEAELKSKSPVGRKKLILNTEKKILKNRSIVKVNKENMHIFKDSDVKLDENIELSRSLNSINNDSKPQISTSEITTKCYNDVIGSDSEDEKELQQIDEKMSTPPDFTRPVIGGGKNIYYSAIHSEQRDRVGSSSDDNLHERIVEKIKAESLARSSPGEEGPFKCPTCKRMYRTRESYELHVRDCDFEVSTSDEEDKPIIKELRSHKRYGVPNEDKREKLSSDVEKLNSLTSSSPSPLNEPLTIIITDEYRDEKFSPSSRDLSDDCSSVQSQDSRRSSLRKSTVTQRNAAPAHLAKARSRDSKLSMSPDGSTCSSLLSPKSSTSRADEKPSPKETMLEAIGLVSRRSLELSPNSDLDKTGAQNKTLRLQPRVSPTTMTVAPKREKRSPAHAGTCGIMRPSILAGGLPKPGSSHLKSIAITYDPVIVEEIKLEPFKPKKPRQKRIWWIEASECPDGETEEKEEAVDEREDEESDEEESVAHRTRQRATSELKSPTIKKNTSGKIRCRTDEPNNHVIDESNTPVSDGSNNHKIDIPRTYSEASKFQKAHENSEKSITETLNEPNALKLKEISSHRTDEPISLRDEHTINSVDITSTLSEGSNAQISDESKIHTSHESNTQITDMPKLLSDESTQLFSNQCSPHKVKGRHNPANEQSKSTLKSGSKLNEPDKLKKDDSTIIQLLPKLCRRRRSSVRKDDDKEMQQTVCSKEDSKQETDLSEGAYNVSKEEQTLLVSSHEVDSVERSSPFKNLRSTRSKERKGKENDDDDYDDNGDGECEHFQQSEDSLMSPLRRSRRPTSKTAKLSEYLTELKKDKETPTKEEVKSQKETTAFSASCDIQSTPPDIVSKRGRGRPKIYPEKERPKLTEKKARGRQRKTNPENDIEQEKLDKNENNASNLTNINHEQVCDVSQDKPVLEAGSSTICLKACKHSHKIQHQSSINTGNNFESTKVHVSLQSQSETKSQTIQNECGENFGLSENTDYKPVVRAQGNSVIEDEFSEKEKFISVKSDKGNHEYADITDNTDNVELIDDSQKSSTVVSDIEKSHNGEAATDFDKCFVAAAENSQTQSSNSPSFSEAMEKRDEDSNSGPPFSLVVPDKSKPPGQKLRIIIRSPNVVAAQTIGELIKKTALSVNPKTLDITVTTRDLATQDIDCAADKFDSSFEKIMASSDEKQVKSYENSRNDEVGGISSFNANEVIEDKDDTPLVSRSGSPDSISAAYDIQSDDFSSETSNDVDDFDSCISNNVDNKLPEVSCATMPQALPHLQPTNSSIATFVDKQKSNNVCSSMDNDDDVVIVKAAGLHPHEPGLALRTSPSYTLINNPQQKLSISPVHTQQYSNALAVMANTSNSVAVTSCGRILTTPPVLQQSGTMSHISQQHIALSPTRQNIHPFMNLHQQTSPQQNQPSVMISEVSPGRFILQQQPNARPDFLTSQDIGQSGLLLQNPGQTGILIQAPNQSGITLQNATQPGIIFRHTNPTGLILPPSNTASLLQGQPPILQSTSQGGLSFISLNPSNPLASTIISPIQPLQSHVTSSPILPSSMGLTPLMQTVTLGSQPLMIGQPFIAQPGMFLPQLSSQPIGSQHSDQIDLARRQQHQQLQSPQPHNPQQHVSSVKPTSIIIDPHAHMLTSGLNQTVLKANMQQYSPLKQRPASVSSGLEQKIQLTATPFSTIQSNTNPSPSLFSLPTTASILASQTLKTYPPNTFASTLNLPKTKLSVPKLTKVDGAPAQVNYMGSFDLNTSSLQSVINDNQSFNQDSSKRIMELVQSALKNQGKEQIPGVEVTTAITNTPQGPKKVLRVFINEDILPGNKPPSSTVASVDVPNSGTSIMSNTSSAMASLLSLGQTSSITSSQTGSNPEWTKLLPSSSQMSKPQQQSQNLWSTSSTGYVSIPISQNMSTNSRPSTQPPGNSRFLPSAQFRRALKPAVYSNHMKRKLTPSSSSASECPQAKRPVFEKTLKSDGIFSGILQQIVERHSYISDPASQNLVSSCISPGLSKLDDCGSVNAMSSSQTVPSGSLVNNTLQEQPQSTFTGTSLLNLPTVASDASTENSTNQETQELTQHTTNHMQHYPYHHIAQEQQQQLQRSPHKRASFPLMSPTKKPQAAMALTKSVNECARKKILQKSVLKKDMLQKCGKESRHQLTEKRKTGVRSRRPNATVVASHHPLIHHKKGAVSLPQPTLEEEVVATPLDLGRGDHPHCSGTKGERERSQSRLRFEITSDDGFSCQGDTVEDAWNQVLEKVQDVRAAARMKQLSYAGISGQTMFGLDHDAVVYLIEQLYGAVHCHRNYKFRFHKYDLDQADEEVALNPSGAARSEFFIGRKPFDMFNFLKSVYRTKPGDDEREKEEEMALKSSRRATSLSLPMAMRFRKLKTFAKEAVDVYRSKIHGRGLFCKRNIDAGEMVIEYAGEVIRASLTDKREKYYESKGIGCYMFRIDDDEVVDATMHGSAARFINHSCEPNCFSKVILVDGKKHIVIFAMRPIKRGEELTYDYKFPIEEVKIPCSCGSKRCRKYLN